MRPPTHQSRAYGGDGEGGGGARHCQRCHLNCLRFSQQLRGWESSVGGRGGAYR